MNKSSSKELAKEAKKPEIEVFLSFRERKEQERTGFFRAKGKGKTGKYGGNGKNFMKEYLNEVVKVNVGIWHTMATS